MALAQRSRGGRLTAVALAVIVQFSAVWGGFGGAPVAVQAADPLHPPRPRRNVILFVADGLRPGSVNATDAPTILSLRERGVNFINSHALFPTFTTANASAIATGHHLGDTGDFSNTIFTGYPIFNTGNFGQAPSTYTPFIENDQILADLDDHFAGDYLGETSLLAVARQHGYNTAAIGKVGPAAIQDVRQLAPVDKSFPVPLTVIIDDATGGSQGVPLPPAIIAALTEAGLGTVAPRRDQERGNNRVPGTLDANVDQQQYFANATTKAVLPAFTQGGRPFVLVYWSRDPDGTQHYQGDSLNRLKPGINGPTSKAAVQEADDNLKQILDYIHGVPALAANTDIFVAADHGFATISKGDLDGTGHHFTSSYAASFVYKDKNGGQEVNSGFLPAGFVAIDLARALNLPLYDPDSHMRDGTGHTVYLPVDPTIPQESATMKQRPANGNGLIGGTGRVLDRTDAKVVVAANGGSDLIYVPDHDRSLVLKIVEFLSRQDYVGGIFVDDRYGGVPGTLPFSAINLKGATALPVPAIVLAFKTFALDPNDPLNTAVQIADTILHQGQGMHGSLGRDNTFNTMAAIGPDFKERYTDQAPVGNADIALTLAKILGFPLPSSGHLRGRVLNEALAGSPASITGRRRISTSKEAASGKSTVLVYQEVDHHRYLDEACFVDKPHRVRRGNPCR